VSKKQAPKPTVKQPIAAVIPPKQSLFTIAIHKNLLVMVVCLITIFVLQKQVVGYHWVWQTLIKENLDMQHKYPKISDQQKGEMKMGYDITYMNYLVEKTPANAVILFPSAEVMLKDTTPDQPKFRTSSGGIYTPLWVQYYAFPRKIVFANEKGKNPNYNKITHVAIVNYSGYEHITYPIDKSNRLGVVPFKLTK
jgi:hypothetical protein